MKNEELQPHLIEKLQEVLVTKKKPLDIQPFNSAHYLSTLEKKDFGESALKKGSLGCLLVAGGQGTRSKLSLPKGMFPISNIKQKSFFQLFAEKTKAASIFAKIPLKLAIMTSPLNDKITREHFYNNSYFGLDETQIDFFCQDMLPFLNDEKKPFFSSECEIAKGPNGNGSAFKKFVESGIWEKWQKANVQYVNFVMIDNPLADPFDISLLDFHISHRAHLTLKCIERESPEEKVGVIVTSENKIKVLEYSEMPKNLFSNSKKFPLANISLFLINMDTLHDISNREMPLHAARKPASYFDKETGTTTVITAWKFEYFIFDILNYLDQVEVLIYPRDACFAPLKNPDDEAIVKQKLLEKDRLVFSSITKTVPPSTLFELDQQFYYPSQELLSKWKGKLAPEESYIRP